jgi:hypothetical protein
MNIFRTATGQAIREIIIDHSQENRFGRSLTEQDLDSICERVVDLFETTLNLRAQLSANGFEATPAPSRQPSSQTGRPTPWEDKPVSAPSTRAAADLYDFRGDAEQKRGERPAGLSPARANEVTLALPRKRISVTAEEKEHLARRSQNGTAAQRPSP